MLDETLNCYYTNMPSPFDPLSEAVRKFANETWEAKKMADKVEEDDSRGMVGKVDNISLMTYVLAGRVMLTWKNEDTGEWVSAVAGEGERPSRQGIGGTISQAIELIQKSGEAWNDGKLTINPSENVGLG